MCEWEGLFNEVHSLGMAMKRMWNKVKHGQDFKRFLLSAGVICQLDFTSNFIITDNFNYKGFILIINQLIRPFIL